MTPERNLDCLSDRGANAFAEWFAGRVALPRRGREARTVHRSRKANRISRASHRVGLPGILSGTKSTPPT
jgi:hypothetical protein